MPRKPREEQLTIGELAQLFRWKEEGYNNEVLSSLVSDRWGKSYSAQSISDLFERWKKVE